MRTLSENLKAARKSAGLTQREAAERAGVTEQAVSGWERGANPPKEENIEALATVYGTTAGALRYGDTTVRTEPVAPVPPPTFSQRARSFINRFLAELIDAGVSAEEEAWARRVLSNPDNIGYNVGGSAPTLDEEAMLRDIEGMSIGVRILLRNRGYKDLKSR